MENKTLNTKEDELSSPPSVDESIVELPTEIGSECDAVQAGVNRVALGDDLDEVEDEHRDLDRSIVREATVKKWLEKAEKGDDLALAPEWVRREIASRSQKEDLSADLSAFNEVLQEVYQKAGLTEAEFKAKYGAALREEIDVLIDYGVPPALALEKAINIVGVRSEADRQRTEQRALSSLPPRSGVPVADEFSVISVQAFDALSDYQRQRYMREAEKRFGEVIFS